MGVKNLESLAVIVKQTFNILAMKRQNISCGRFYNKNAKKIKTLGRKYFLSFYFNGEYSTFSVCWLI
jgi:hypothetical protein